MPETKKSKTDRGTAINPILKERPREHGLWSSSLAALRRDASRVYAGIPPEAASYLAEHVGEEPLSNREVEVLRQVGEGNRNRDIAKLRQGASEAHSGKARGERSDRGSSDRRAPGIHSPPVTPYIRPETDTSRTHAATNDYGEAYRTLVPDRTSDAVRSRVSGSLGRITRHLGESSAVVFMSKPMLDD